jgi:uncharacterized membrane protein YdjX (TVP38/TMEM64 family)
VSAESLWVLCLLLFADGATFAFFTTPLLLQYGKFHPPWTVALAGGAASAAGSAVQLAVMRWALRSDRPWLRRFLPAREKLQAALDRYPSATFLAILLARATPLPDAPIKLVAAAADYPVWRYALALTLGALPYYYALALIGNRVRIPNWVLAAAAVAIVIGFVVDRLRKRTAQAG